MAKTPCMLGVAPPFESELTYCADPATTRDTPMPYDELFLAQATTFRDYQARRDASYRQTLKELVANRTVEGDIQPNSLEGGAILASLGEWDPKQACWDESKGQPIDCWRESNPWQGRVDIYNPTPPGSMLTSVLNKSTALPTSILSEPGSFDHAVMGYNPSALPYRSDVMASAGVPVSAANYYTPLRPLMDPYPTTDIMTWSRDAWRPPADPNVDMWNEESPSEPPICTGSLVDGVPPAYSIVDAIKATGSSFRLPVFDQGDTKACTATAMCAGFAYRLAFLMSLFPERMRGRRYSIPSPAYVFYYVRQLQCDSGLVDPENCGCDKGAPVTMAAFRAQFCTGPSCVMEDCPARLRSCATVMDGGVAEESVWPWDASSPRIMQQPSTEAQISSTHMRLSKSFAVNYYSCGPVRALEALISNGIPVAFSLRLWPNQVDWFDAYKTPIAKTMDDAVLPVARKDLTRGPPDKGHAMVALGYNRTKTQSMASSSDHMTMVGHMPGMILVLDSHGTRSGYNGFLYVPYTVFSDPDAMVEMQAIVDVCAPSENVKPGEKATMGSGRLCVDKCPAYLPISVNQTSDGSFDPDLTHVCQTVSTSAHRGLQ